MADINCGVMISCAMFGLDGVRVDIEVAILPGLPHFHIVGLGDAAVREARNRVHAALHNSGFGLPARRVTASYAPAWLPKTGSAFDLPLALAILIASTQIRRPCRPVCALGELGLDGTIRPVPGVLCRLSALTQLNPPPDVLIPSACRQEASLLPGLRLLPVDNLRQAARLIESPAADDRGRSRPPGDALPGAEDMPEDDHEIPDLTMIRGQPQGVRAAQLAAAGLHHLLLIGAPGCGKTTIARATAGLLPPLDETEALMVTRIHSATGRLNDSILRRRRPFRMPHHSVTRPTLIGGGAIPVPGEISLAHHGVLFLDEMTEFRAETLDALRQPMEEHEIHLYRLRHRFVYPADFLLIGAANPCRCGEYLEPGGTCRCTPDQQKRHLSRISGPLLDRIDLVVEMTRPDGDAISAGMTGPSDRPPCQDQLGRRVRQCREFQFDRCRRRKEPVRLNGRQSGMGLAQRLEIDPQLIREGAAMANALQLSVRGYHRLLRLARTIADYELSDRVRSEHLAEALQYRLHLDAEVRS